jgi:transposase, IS5 family
VIQLRYSQRHLGEVFFAQEVETLWEPWMRQVDQILEDEQLLEMVYGRLARRWPRSATRGRKHTPAEVVLRLMVLRHLRNLSFAMLEREVRANLLYRMFTRIGTEKVPDSKTLARLGQALGTEVIEQIHGRLIEMARQQKLIRGRKMRVDTTVDVATLCDASLSL